MIYGLCVSDLSPPPLSLSGRNLIHIMLLNSAVRPDRLACSVEVISERVLLPPRFPSLSHTHTHTHTHNLLQVVL